MKNEDRRLIEDYLPLDTLNAIASKRKLHPRHYVSLIHYWPARRPNNCLPCRDLCCACSCSEHWVRKREEAASFVTKLAAFKPDSKAIKEARDRIQKQHGGLAPKILDMFAGGGAIPLEVARLGCESHAIDYNPVAHLIELCTLVYPQTFGASLADDFQRWATWYSTGCERETSVICIHRSRYTGIIKTVVSHQTQLFGGSRRATRSTG